MKNENDLERLLDILQKRFDSNMNRHEGLSWKEIRERLESDPGKLMILSKMEATGGEPDAVGYDEATGEYIFFDCSPESPEGRRSLCYDVQALESRKKQKPAGSAIGMADKIGIDILSEEEYRYLQSLGSFDEKFIYPAFGVTLRNNQREWYYKKLDERFPGIKAKYISTYGNSYECRSHNSKKLWALFKSRCDEYGILYRMEDIIREYKKPYQAEQLSFL